jgi:hypothetical protein
LHHIDDLTASLEKEDGEGNGKTESKDGFPKSQFAPGRPISGENLLRPKKKEPASLLRNRLGMKEGDSYNTKTTTVDPLDMAGVPLPTLLQTQSSSESKKHAKHSENIIKPNGSKSKFREIPWIAWIFEFFDLEKPKKKGDEDVPFLVSDFQAHLWHVNGNFLLLERG